MSQEQTLNNNGLEIQGIIIGKGRACVKNIIETSWLYRNWIFLLWCLIVVLDDTWLFYIPTVNNDKMCIELDKVLWISAGANRSLFDLFYVIHNIFRFHTGISKTARKWSWPFFLIDILIILPVPQINHPGATDLSYGSKNERHPIFLCHEIFSCPTCAKGYPSIQSLHESTGSEQTC